MVFGNVLWQSGFQLQKGEIIDVEGDELGL